LQIEFNDKHRWGQPEAAEQQRAALGILEGRLGTGIGSLLAHLPHLFDCWDGHAIDPDSDCLVPFV